ncbi:hypothetical protein NMG60_11000053 [Bertholletia excelsa]
MPTRSKCLISHESSEGFVTLPFPFSDENDLSIVSSCRGLICINLSGDDTRICLWNPATREFRILPNDPEAHPVGCFSSVCLGFGFDIASGDYKVVKFVDSMGVRVGRRGRDCWSEVDSVFSNFFNRRVSKVSR